MQSVPVWKLKYSKKVTINLKLKYSLINITVEGLQLLRYHTERDAYLELVG